MDRGLWRAMAHRVAKSRSHGTYVPEMRERAGVALI